MGVGNPEQNEQEIKPANPTEASKSFLTRAKEAADRLLNLYGTKTGTAMMTAVNILGGSVIVDELRQGDVEKAILPIVSLVAVNILALRKPIEEPPRDARGRFVKRTPKK